MIAFCFYVHFTQLQTFCGVGLVINKCHDNVATVIVHMFSILNGPVNMVTSMLTTLDMNTPSLSTSHANRDILKISWLTCYHILKCLGLICCMLACLIAYYIHGYCFFPVFNREVLDISAQRLEGNPPSNNSPDAWSPCCFFFIELNIRAIETILSSHCYFNGQHWLFSVSIKILTSRTVNCVQGFGAFDSNI